MNEEKEKRKSKREEKRIERRKNYGRLVRSLMTATRQVLRFILSRYFIVLLIITAEILLLEHLVFTIAENMLITTAVVIILDVIGFVHLINRDANPEYKLTWLVVMMIPLAGVTIYFLFYDRRLSSKEMRLLIDSHEQLHRFEEKDIEIDEDSPHYGKVKALLSADPLAKIYRGTESTFYEVGEDYFDALTRDLQRAKKYIYLEYFIIERGELWDKIHEILKAKAAEGLDIRVLYDDIGCMQTLPSYYEYVLRSEGIKAYRFGRVTPKLSSVHNNRDHRKIAVIDGVIGYTGGVNIADEYVNIKEKCGHWKDGGIRIFGDGAEGLLRLFLSAWDFTIGETTDHASAFIEREKTDVDDGGIYVPFGSGPAPVYSQKVGKNLLLNIINQATRYVYVTTPYLIMDYELTEALCKASLRGVKVKIITPGIADKRIVKVMTKSSYPYLIKNGVEIYEYLPGFIHEKTLISDDKYLISGTINLDYRSLMHHFEDGVFVIDSPTVKDALLAFDRTIEKSDFRDRIESKLTFIEWVVRNLIRIFAPIM